MAFNFPNSPADGAIFIPVAGGPTYVWSASTGAWRLASGGLNAGVYIGDAPPANPVQGQLWWESDSGNSFIYFNDGNSLQWVQFNTGLLPDVPSVPKVTAFTASGTWTPDVKMLHGYAVGKGGGGGGGGCTAQVAFSHGCCGGGEGATVYKFFRKSTITNPTYAVTVGAGGAGVSAAQGASGGDTIVASLFTAKGGAGGAQYGAGQCLNGSTGDIIIPGATGGMGSQGTTASNTGGYSGSGGGAGGGVGMAAASAGQAPAGGPAVANSGGGGGGAASYGAGPGPIIGGAGGSGIVWIIEYCTP